jgi:hypothetical protein
LLTGSGRITGPFSKTTRAQSEATTGGQVQDDSGTQRLPADTRDNEGPPEQGSRKVTVFAMFFFVFFSRSEKTVEEPKRFAAAK